MSAIYHTGAGVAVMCSCSLTACFVFAGHLATAAVAIPSKVVKHNNAVMVKWGSYSKFLLSIVGYK
jgi:hypothetical protein